MTQTTIKSRYRIRGGISFTAVPFSKIEIPSLPDHVRVPVRRDELNVKVGDTVLTGQPITTSSSAEIACHASLSGVINAITDNFVEIKSDGLDTPFVTSAINPTDYQKFFRSMGLVGLGGAAFPVDKKLASAPVETLLVNAAECDPAIYCDEALMQERAAEVVNGIKIAQRATNAKRCIVGIEENKVDAITAMRAHLPDHIDLVTVPAIYPSGAEKTLHYLCTGKTGALGTGNAICFNVSTCYAMYKAVEFSQPLISRIVTIVQNTSVRNIELRIGTPLSYLQQLIDAALPDEFICGGSMMGWPVTINHVIEKRTNSLLLDPATPENSLPCIRCGACADVCPESLYPQQLLWHAKPYNPQALTELNISQCIECGSCDAVCPSHIPLTGIFANAKETMRYEISAQGKADVAKFRYEKRLSRLNNQDKRQRRELDEKTAQLSDNNKAIDARKALIAKALKRNQNKKAHPASRNKNQDSPQ